MGDCECLLKTIQGDGPEASDNSSSYTRLIHQHEICSIRLYLKCSFDDFPSRYDAYREKEPAKWFAEKLKSIAEFVEKLHGNPKKMETLTTAEEVRFRNSGHRHICEKPLNKMDRHRDHSHLYSSFRGPAHPLCNLLYQDSRLIPVIFHSFSGYDVHFIISVVSNLFPGNVDSLPT
ncbi:hypothetical protein QAD02_002715 [Eretmocerus hayati]|uniref:Uncharacterized protein n=1 Tax=Eretmocerus hayati TaxID=131215 RepID=A0ACC2NLF5_9HYME|nr:hypothetical protein QAD02_002715 [Eretmocerus hayati]